jgi:hypothetical protein
MTLLICAAAPAQAGERRFTYVYEATTLPKGTLELETWVTWKTRNASGGINDDTFDFRHEIEYGVTDRFQLALYLPDWTLKDDEKHNWHSRFKDVGVEAVYNLTNPTTDWLGSALYGEVKIGDRYLVLEGKLLLQKNFGPWIVAYNAIVEAEFEGAHLDEETGEFKQTAGISYQVNPSFTVGAELLHEIAYPEWTYGNRSDQALYVGPNASLRFGNFFVTATVLAQVSDIEDEPDVQTRMICGFHF